jgi:signal transduction histidine kinase
MPKKQIPQRIKVAVVFTLLNTFGLVLLAFILFFNAKRDALQSAEDNLIEQTETVAEVIKNYPRDGKKGDEELKDILSKIIVGDTGYIYMLDEYGNYILSLGRQREGENIYEAKDADGEYFIKEMLKHADENEVYISYYPWKNKGETNARLKIAATIEIPERDWYVTLATYHAEFLGSLAKTKAFLMTLLSIVILLNVFLVPLLSSKLLRPKKS